MADIRIVTYLQENIQAGYDKYELCNALVAAGHSPAEVNKALESIHHADMPKPPASRPSIENIPEPPPPKKEQLVPSSKVLLFGSGLVILLVLGGIIFFTQSLSSLPPSIEKTSEKTSPATGIPQIPVQCKECEYDDASSCKKAVCCKDNDCDDNTTTTADTCDAPGTKDARCVRSTIICGNHNCEKEEEKRGVCCLDCGCSPDFTCVENKCLPTTTPIISILSPKKDENVSLPFVVDISTKDAGAMHARLVIDKGSPREISGTKITVNTLSLGIHEITIVLVDKNEKEITQKTIPVAVVPPPPVPMLTVIHPTVDEEIKGDAVVVEFTVQGVALAKDAFHLSLTLDEQKIKYDSLSAYTFQGVLEGKHTLNIALVDRQGHQLTNPESFKTVPFSTVASSPQPIPPIPPTLTQSTPSEITVVMQNNQFIPSLVTIKKGTIVRWINKDDSVPHTVTAVTGQSFDSGSINGGKEYSHTFDAAGTYNYGCQFHSPYMKGTINVTD